MHAAILLNVMLGYYEYFSGHRLIPLTLGSVVVLGEWRASAFLGHPLTASGVVAAYVLAMVLRPALCPPLVVRLPLITLSLGSLMAFGGRTALMTVLAILSALALVEGFKLLRGKRTSLPVAIIALCLLFVFVAGIFAALNLGIFDKMLLRFSSDKGITLARYATFSLLSHFDWQELLLGPNSGSSQRAAIAARPQLRHREFLGVLHRAVRPIHTALLTLGLVCFFIEILRSGRNRPPGRIVLLILLIAASSVSFSSKNIQLAQFIVLITLLFPRVCDCDGPRPSAASPA